jgi:hypothetical protein
MGGIGQASLGRGIDPQFSSTPTGSDVSEIAYHGFWPIGLHPRLFLSQALRAFHEVYFHRSA